MYLAVEKHKIKVVIFYQWKWSNLIGWAAFQTRCETQLPAVKRNFSLWNATARCETQLPAVKRNCPLWNATARFKCMHGFRAKNRGVKQFLN